MRQLDGTAFDSIKSTAVVPRGTYPFGYAHTADFAELDLFESGFEFEPLNHSFSNASFPADTAVDLVAQYWGKIPAPGSVTGYARDSGYATYGPVIKLHWQNPGSGTQFVTQVNGPALAYSDIRAPEDSATSEVVTADSSYAYSLWSFSDHEVSTLSLTQPAGDSTATISVYAPPRLTADVSGPETIAASGSYRWHANPGGGMGSSYGFKWMYQEAGCCHSIVTLRGTSESVTKTVVDSANMYAFRLITNVSDYPAGGHYYADSLGGLIVVVLGSGGFGAPAATVASTASTSLAGGTDSSNTQGLALLDEDGRCVIVPDTHRERQALFRRIWRSGTPFTRCTPGTAAANQ